MMVRLRVVTAVAAALFCCAAEASAASYVDVTYSGTATGYDGGGLFGAPRTSYANVAFSDTWHFYEDLTDPTQNHMLGFSMTLNGNTFELPPISYSGDYIVPEVGRFDSYFARTIFHGGYRYIDIANTISTPDMPTSTLEDYTGSTSYPGPGRNRFYVEGHPDDDGSPGFGTGFFLRPTQLDVETFDGPAPSGCCQMIPGAHAVPEPGIWAFMLLGFFGLGGALRARRQQALVAQ